MPKLNLPNRLTVLRVLLVPCFVVFMMIESLFGLSWLPRLLAAALFGACALTDLFDGYLARKYGQVTDFGKFLDPIADKFMVISAMVAFCASGAYAYMRLWVFIATLLVILRELAVTSIRLLMAGRNTVVAAAWPGKVKTVCQIVFVLVAMLEPVFLGASQLFTYLSLAVAVISTVLSGLSYIKHYLPILLDRA